MMRLVIRMSPRQQPACLAAPALLGLLLLSGAEAGVPRRRRSLLSADSTVKVAAVDITHVTPANATWKGSTEHAEACLSRAVVTLKDATIMLAAPAGTAPGGPDSQAAARELEATSRSAAGLTVYMQQNLRPGGMVSAAVAAASDTDSFNQDLSQHYKDLATLQGCAAAGKVYDIMAQVAKLVNFDQPEVCKDLEGSVITGHFYEEGLAGQFNTPWRAYVGTAGSGAAACSA